MQNILLETFVQWNQQYCGYPGCFLGVIPDQTWTSHDGICVILIFLNNN